MSCDPHNRASRNDPLKSDSDLIQSAVMDCFPHLNDWIAADQISFMWLTNFSNSSKEELRQSLKAGDGKEICLLGISYSDTQSHSCRSTPKHGGHTLPRCKSYRLCKSTRRDDSLTDPLATLSVLARRTAQLRMIYFSRHGDSQFNVMGKVGGDADLSPRGLQYANCLADYVNGTLNESDDLTLWTSCLRRTIQTAQGIHTRQERLAELNELDSGVCEGMTYEEIAARFPFEFAARDHDKFKYRYPGGESYEDLLKRVQPVLLRLQTMDNVLVIAHQAVLRCLLGTLLKKERKELPYINAPLHTIMRVACSSADGCRLELIPLSIECVDTNRAKPMNCSENRTAEEALLTVPAHF